MKLLLILDSQALARSLYSLLHKFYQIQFTDRASIALRKIAAEVFDVIVLDLNIPDKPGLEVCEEIRGRGILTPILILGESSDIPTKTLLLDSGANDYIVKPFDNEELLSRLRVQVRQVLNSTTKNKIVVGDIVLDSKTRSAWKGGLPLCLRGKEYEILECLALNYPNTVHQQILSDYVWNGYDVASNNIHVHISQLRQKLGTNKGNPIQTIHGIGYALI